MISLKIKDKFHEKGGYWAELVAVLDKEEILVKMEDGSTRLVHDSDIEDEIIKFPELDYPDPAA